MTVPWIAGKLLQLSAQISEPEYTYNYQFSTLCKPGMFFRLKGRNGSVILFEILKIVPGLFVFSKVRKLKMKEAETNKAISRLNIAEEVFRDD